MRTAIGLLTAMLLFGTGCSPDSPDGNTTANDNTNRDTADDNSGNAEGVRPGAAQTEDSTTAQPSAPTDGDANRTTPPSSGDTLPPGDSTTPSEGSTPPTR
jgi:hypothetical protein